MKVKVVHSVCSICTAILRQGFTQQVQFYGLSSASEPSKLPGSMNDQGDITATPHQAFLQHPPGESGAAQPQGPDSTAFSNGLPQAESLGPAQSSQLPSAATPQSWPQLPSQGDTTTAKTYAASDNPLEAYKRAIQSQKLNPPTRPHKPAPPQLQGPLPLPRFGPHVMGAPQIRTPYPPRGPPASAANQLRPASKKIHVPQGQLKPLTTAQAAHLAQRNSSPQLGPSSQQQQGPQLGWGLPPPAERQGSTWQPQGMPAQAEQKHYSRAGQKLLMLVRLGDLKLPATVRKPYPLSRLLILMLVPFGSKQQLAPPCSQDEIIATLGGVDLQVCVPVHFLL